MIVVVTTVGRFLQPLEFCINIFALFAIMRDSTATKLCKATVVFVNAGENLHPLYPLLDRSGHNRFVSTFNPHQILRRILSKRRPPFLCSPKSRLFCNETNACGLKRTSGR